MMHLVHKQIEGLPLIDTEQEIKVEYQLRAKRSGRILHIHVFKDVALKQAEERNLDCYKVTTISEKM